MPVVLPSISTGTPALSYRSPEYYSTTCSTTSVPTAGYYFFSGVCKGDGAIFVQSLKMDVYYYNLVMTTPSSSSSHPPPFLVLLVVRSGTTTTSTTRTVFEVVVFIHTPACRLRRGRD